MNRFFIIFFFLFATAAVEAQIHEVGVFLGGSNFIGDVGSTTYIAPNKLAFGLLYKWNRSPRHSWRFSYTQSTVAGDDADSEIDSRQERNYRFKNSMKELTAGLEFDFFTFDLHDSKPQFTPYVFTGLSYLFYDGLYFQYGGPNKDKTYRTFAIPMTVGVKGRVFGSFVIGFEVAARNTFKDDLDGSNPTNGNMKNLQFGNLTSKDWYMFTGFTLTYTFGEKPCFCAD
ncbi:DUF6089 family protein [Flavobacterium sp.]|uniref:type IX secretion system protein PorG n=1 Tax=Flavobacterium sp. TaxID=239 RepID=UPI00261D500B|nr:DUF6089 family protein [Flavobacterium sp.]